jgi:Pyruvate/2-oxoacid:ferredoxin oxidoreductase gamma subunit
VVINSTRSAFEIVKEVGQVDGEVFTLDATEISVTLFGQTSIPFTNVIMVGAFSKVTRTVKIGSIIRVLPTSSLRRPWRRTEEQPGWVMREWKRS